MCIICIDYQKSLITVREARGILSEMAENIDSKHLEEINEMLEGQDKNEETT